MEFREIDKSNYWDCIALTIDDSQEGFVADNNSIIEKLLQNGIDTRLVVLEASYQTVHDRILARGEEEGCWCMENIELAREGSAALPGTHIQTDGKSVENLMDELLTVHDAE